MIVTQEDLAGIPGDHLLDLLQGLMGRLMTVDDDPDFELVIGFFTELARATQAALRERAEASC